MTDAELEAVRKWLKGEEYVTPDFQNDLYDGMAHVRALLAEVERLRAAVAEEREACARLAESEAYSYLPSRASIYHAVDAIAISIRARGKDGGQ